MSCCQQILLSINLIILGVFFSHLFSLLSSRLSRCFSTRESANPVAAQLRYRWRATLPCLKATLRSSSRRVFSHRNASASNKCKPCCSTVAPSMARSAIPAAALLHHRWRATLFHPKATLRSSSRRGSHRNVSASNSTQYSNEYPNLALSSSSLKLQTML